MFCISTSKAFEKGQWEKSCVRGAHDGLESFSCKGEEFRSRCGWGQPPLYKWTTVFVIMGWQMMFWVSWNGVTLRVYRLCWGACIFDIESSPAAMQRHYLWSIYGLNVHVLHGDGTQSVILKLLNMVNRVEAVIETLRRKAVYCKIWLSGLVLFTKTMCFDNTKQTTDREDLHSNLICFCLNCNADQISTGQMPIHGRSNLTTVTSE